MIVIAWSTGIVLLMRGMIGSMLNTTQGDLLAKLFEVVRMMVTRGPQTTVIPQKAEADGFAIRGDIV